MSTVSIIVPVYKVEPYIHRCIDSILGQSFSDFELILVDDGSPDNCGAICDEYARQDCRIHVIHQKNGGLSAARNAGIDWVLSGSDSQWLTFVDSDDWLHKDYLKTLLHAAHQQDARIAACGLLRTDTMQEDPDLSACTVVSMDSQRAYAECYGMCMTACCKIYRKELFDNVRFPVGKLHEDCYITHMPLFAAGKVAICDVPLYYYYTNPDSITRTRWTPRRLEEIDAHEHRLAYLQTHGYQAAVKRELEVYADTLLEQAEILQQMQKEDKSCAAYLNQLRKKLRWVLGQEKTVGALTCDKGKHWVMLMAYAAGPAYDAALRLKKRKNAIK